MIYAEGVLADRKRISSNAFSVEKAGRKKPSAARFALQPWATRNNTFGVDDTPEVRRSFPPWCSSTVGGE